MARTKKGPRRSTGGKAPRKELATKPVLGSYWILLAIVVVVLSLSPYVYLKSQTKQDTLKPPIEEFQKPLVEDTFKPPVEEFQKPSPVEEVKKSSPSSEIGGVMWALLVAGSFDYDNYRHQSDVCHAYQVLRMGGLKKKNIVVMMFDDIAFHPRNPNPGFIVQIPFGKDYYVGVPKDYVGTEVTWTNVLAVLSGDKTAVRGGSGKVIDSKKGDRIFFYYSDHGSEDALALPNVGDILKTDLFEAIKEKHQRGTYESMLIFIEACMSGNTFHKLPKDISVYAVTASRPNQNSYAVHCGDPFYKVCLGDEFSANWMKFSETQNLSQVNVGELFKYVKSTTFSSNVSQYGDMKIKAKKLSWFFGNGLKNINSVPLEDEVPTSVSYSQEEAPLMIIWQMYVESSGLERAQALEQIRATLAERARVDLLMKMIVVLLVGSEKSDAFLYGKSEAPQNDEEFDCFLDFVRVFERFCGVLTEYAKKYLSTFSNICDSRVVALETFEDAVMDTCGNAVKTTEFTF